MNHIPYGTLKPRIRKGYVFTNLWVCYGSKAFALGFTPLNAYSNWLTELKSGNDRLA